MWKLWKTASCPDWARKSAVHAVLTLCGRREVCLWTARFLSFVLSTAPKGVLSPCGGDVHLTAHRVVHRVLLIRNDKKGYRPR